MEIYKLKDEVPEGRKRRDGVFSRSDDAGDGVLKITEMKQGVKNPNRVNVYVNGSFSLSLDVAQVVDLGVKVGMVLTVERLEELKKASEFGKLYQRALEWVLMRPRSVRETKDYLARKLRISSSDTLRSRPSSRGSLAIIAPAGAPMSSEDISELSNNIINRLVDKGYLDDRRFAEFWVENRFVKKGVSRKRLMMELSQKGVSREIIEEVLDGRNDEDELRKMIARKRVKYAEPEKLIAYLCRQGFSYDLVKRLVEED